MWPHLSDLCDSMVKSVMWALLKNYVENEDRCNNKITNEQRFCAVTTRKRSKFLKHLCKARNSAIACCKPMTKGKRRKKKGSHFKTLQVGNKLDQCHTSTDHEKAGSEGRVSAKYSKNFNLIRTDVTSALSNHSRCRIFGTVSLPLYRTDDDYSCRSDQNTSTNTG